MMFSNDLNHCIFEYCTVPERAVLSQVNTQIYSKIKDINTFEARTAQKNINELLNAKTTKDLEKTFWRMKHLAYLSPKALKILVSWSENLGGLYSDGKIEASARLLGLNIKPTLRMELPAFTITDTDIDRAFKRLKHSNIEDIRERFLNSRTVRDDQGEVVSYKHTFNYPTWAEKSFIFSDLHKSFQIIQKNDMGFNKGIYFKTKRFIKILCGERYGEAFFSIFFIPRDSPIPNHDAHFWVSPHANFVYHDDMPEDFKDTCDLIFHGNVYF